MKKTILSAALLLAGVLGTWADDYKYISVKTTGSDTATELSTVQKITFEDADMVLHTTDGTVKYPLAQMESIYFTATPTAIEALPTQSSQLHVAGSTLQVQAGGMLCVYATNGTLTQVAQVKEGDTVDLTSLTHGVYILKLGKQVIKVRR